MKVEVVAVPIGYDECDPGIDSILLRDFVSPSVVLGSDALSCTSTPVGGVTALPLQARASIGTDTINTAR